MSRPGSFNNVASNPRDRAKPKYLLECECMHAAVVSIVQNVGWFYKETVSTDTGGQQQTVSDCPHPFCETIVGAGRGSEILASREASFCIFKVMVFFSSL